MKSAKIMLLGAIGVGKTSLAKRLVFDTFAGDYKTTIGVDIYTHDLAGSGGSDPLRLVLWDTDGDFGQSIFSSAYVLGAAGAVIVADGTRPATVDHMQALVETFKERMPGRPVLPIVNKCDLAAAGGSNIPARISGHDVVNTSALEGTGVREAFAAIGQDIIRRGL
ncbi:MAG: GTP-binding protein [Hyphomicrobiales bacterium]|nr:GTP-binding protein [Hyphomicrobiales bacterium]